MFRLLNTLFVFVLCGATAIHAPTPPQSSTQALSLMREYRCIKLGMYRDEVKARMGKTSRAGMAWDEFKLGGSDLMTARYDDKGAVKTIQLYFANPAHAPAWTEVVGNTEVQRSSNGAKYARAANEEENFWVMMFQSKTGAVTTITLSR
jgi:hypothetical protein